MGPMQGLLARSDTAIPASCSVFDAVVPGPGAAATSIRRAAALVAPRPNVPPSRDRRTLQAMNPEWLQQPGKANSEPSTTTRVMPWATSLGAVSSKTWMSGMRITR
jgi:hypothetical protein